MTRPQPQWQDLPRSCEVLIIGGGIAGASVAYHLAGLGVRGVLLVEQNRLAGGTTWHAAGLVGRLRASAATTRLNCYSASLYAALEAETGIAAGWRRSGSLMLARAPERMAQLRRQAAMAELVGVEARLIGPDEVRARWPLLRVEDLEGAVWLPDDGRVDPEAATRALAKGAEDRGARIAEGVQVSELLERDGRIGGVHVWKAAVADSGKVCLRGFDIESPCVVLCGGIWARQLARRRAVRVPICAVEHHYAVSAPIAGVSDALPVVRDPDGAIYLRPEGEAIVLGAFQSRSRPWEVERVPKDFSFRLLEPDWSRFGPALEAGRFRVPALEEASWTRFVNGPEAFTPDNQCILGEAPELPGLFLACGFNSAGIACAGGAGKLIAEWIAGGEPPEGAWSFDPRRFDPRQDDDRFLRERASETLGLHYRVAWPNYEYETGRGRRRSPLHERWAARRAAFGERGSWELPLFFAPPGAAPELRYSFGRPSWFEISAAECRAAREGVAIVDLSSLSKYVVQGGDALSHLERLLSSRIDRPAGRAVRALMLNRRGGIEAELTVLRLDRHRFYVLSGPGLATRDLHWMRRHLPPGARARIDDATEAFGAIGLIGPRARELVSRLAGAALDDAVFPPGAWREIGIAGAAAWALRAGWRSVFTCEIHVPAPDLAAVHAAIEAAGADLGLATAGHYAIESLRLEEGRPVWGLDFGPDDTPMEAGLDALIDWEKPERSIGLDALEARRLEAPRWRILRFTLEDPAPMLWGQEPIRCRGRWVGATSSAAYGHGAGAAVALGWVENPEGLDAAALCREPYEIFADGVPSRAAAGT